jgi:hypothetical protein
MTVFDADGDRIQALELRNDNGAPLTWWADWHFVDAPQGYVTWYPDNVTFKTANQPGTQNLSVRAFDGIAWSEWEDVTIESFRTNFAPVVNTTNISLQAGTYAPLDLFAAFSDADGDAINKVELWSAEGARPVWSADGITGIDASSGYLVSDISSIHLSDNGFPVSVDLWIRAYDGIDWGEWSQFNYTTYADNTPTIVTVEDLSVHTGAMIRLSDVVSITDAEGDALSWIELWNASGTTFNWWVDGQIVDGTFGFIVPDIDSVWIVAQDWVGKQDLWVRSWNGEFSGEWDHFTLATYSENHAPTVSVDNLYLPAGEWTKLSDVASIANPDGDFVEEYELWNAWGSTTTWWADGHYVDASNGYKTTDLNSIWFRAQDTAGSQDLWVRGRDGTDWGEWDQFTLTSSQQNRAPSVTVEDHWAPAGEWTKLTDIVSVSDPDGDFVEEYELWNIWGATTTWWADGHYVDASSGYKTMDLDSIWIRTQDWTGTQDVWIRGRDGTDWGQWDQFDLGSYLV